MEDTRNTALSHVIDIFKDDYFILLQWQTDEQTDRQIKMPQQDHVLHNAVVQYRKNKYSWQPYLQPWQQHVRWFPTSKSL